VKGGSHAAARERRAEYCRLRDDGLSISEAFARAAGGDGHLSTQRLYERWYRALKRGETPVPGQGGRPRKAGSA
jgi:hypothetical protein